MIAFQNAMSSASSKRMQGGHVLSSDTEGWKIALYEGKNLYKSVKSLNCAGTRVCQSDGSTFQTTE